MGHKKQLKLWNAAHIGKPNEWKKSECWHAVGTDIKEQIVHADGGQVPNNCDTIVVYFKWCPYCGTELQKG